MTSTSLLGPNYEKFKDRPWYRYNAPEIEPAVVRIFEQRGIPPADLVQHVEQIHHKAFEMCPWPVVGGYYFLQLFIRKQEIYPTILARLQRGDTNILDLGCGLGQDVRALITDGVPSRNIYALDYFQEYWDVGFELFNDRIGTGRGMEEVDFRRHDFIQQEIPEAWEGKMDVIFAGAFFHVFDYNDQVIASRKAAKLMRPQPGSIVFGYQLGRTTAIERPMLSGASKSKMAFWNDRESFDKIWQDIGAELDVRFKTHMTLDANNIEGFTKLDDQMRRALFVVERLS